MDKGVYAICSTLPWGRKGECYENRCLWNSLSDLHPFGRRDFVKDVVAA